MIVINKKCYPVQMSAVKSYTDFMEGSLDLKHNCQVGTHTHGGVVIDRQVTQTIWMFGALWDTAFQRISLPLDGGEGERRCWPDQELHV